MGIAASENAAATSTGQLGLYELSPGDTLAGRFRIESMLGVGGMGMVYRAHDLALDVDVAIKLLRPELARRPESFERFRQELLLARQVSSSHVVRIHDIAQDAGRWFISMDYIDGESLERRLDSNAKLPTSEAIAITHDLLDGLIAAHGSGVVHRDMKPANILIDKSDSAFITDFGVARSLGTTGMTHTGMIIGTPEYLSPEQARGENVDARSDLYSVGLIVFEMLAGELPFSAGTPAETVMQRIVRAPPSLATRRPDLPRWLHAFVDRLLKLNPGHRFASAGDALRALESRHVPRQPINRRALLLAMLVVVGAAGSVYRIAQRVHGLPVPVAIVPATPQLALLPFTPRDGDDQSAALARALNAHLHAWLRSDASVGVIPRRRVLQAIARTAPDARGDTLLRLLPAVANAANASRVLHGDVSSDGHGMVLNLSVVDPDSTAPMRKAIVQGKDAAGLFAAYQAAIPDFLASTKIHVGVAPVIPASGVLDFGRALLDTDMHKDADAVNTLMPLSNAATHSALLTGELLDAEAAANQPLPAQSARDSIIKQFGNMPSPQAQTLYALALSGDGDDAKAGRALQRALNDYPHDADLILAYADNLRAGDKRAEATALLKRYLANASDDAQAWFLLGRTAIENGDARSAVENYLLHAQTLNTLARNSSAEAETRNAIGIGYERLGQLDAAAEQYQRAVAIRERLGQKAELAKSLRNLAIVQAEQGQREQAERTLGQARDLLESLGDRASISDLYNDRGVVAEETGDFAEALKFYRQAYALRQQLDDPAKVAESLNNIGFCAYRMGDFDNASVYWKQALAQYRKIGDHNGMLHIQQSTGLLDIAHGQFAQARKDLTASLQYSQQHQLPEEAAVADISLAELSLLEGRYADARNSADQAARVFARRSDELGAAEAAVLKARIALAFGDSASAKTLAAAVDPKRLNDEQTAEYQLALASLAGLNGDLRGRAVHLDDAAKAALRAHSGTLITRIDLQRARLALASGGNTSANKSLEKIRAQTTRLGEVPLRLEWLELEIANALRNRKMTDAKARYREVLPILKQVGRYAYASTLHRLGARALAGNEIEVAAAKAAASAAQKQILDDAPADLRVPLENRLKQRWNEEVGDGNGT
ncbi:MAG: protein kinase [Rudaea sp.]